MTLDANGAGEFERQIAQYLASIGRGDENGANNFLKNIDTIRNSFLNHVFNFLSSLLKTYFPILTGLAVLLGTILSNKKGGLISVLKKVGKSVQVGKSFFLAAGGVLI